MANRDNFYQRLTKLFRSGPSIRRQIKGHKTLPNQDKGLASPNFGNYAGGMPLGKSSSPFSVLGGYGILDRISRYAEFCFDGDTLVYTPKGVFSMQELANLFPNGERIQVYSYDHNKKSIVLAEAHHPRLTKEGLPQELVKITFDDGGFVKVTKDHKMLLRSGEYIEAQFVEPNTALMPFHVKDITDTGYKSIYTINKSEGNSYGWTTEHKLVAEHFLGRELLPNEVVHHLDFNPSNNTPENLKVMTELEHKQYHAKLNNKNKFDVSNKKHSEWMKANNPALRKDVTFERIFDVATQVDFSMAKTMEWLKVDQNVLKRRLRKAGFSNWKEFAQEKGVLTTLRNAAQVLTEMRTLTPERMASVRECSSIYEASSTLNCTENSIRRFLKRQNLGTWSEFKGKPFVLNSKSLDSNFDTSVSYQDICNAYQPGMTLEDLAKSTKTTINKVKTRLEREGWPSFFDWCNLYKNHKVTAVEVLTEKKCVYNLTVDKHHNLAVGSLLEQPVKSKSGKTSRVYSMVICRQSEMEYTPELATALNIYADETCSSDEKGKCFHVYSENPEIKKQLEELFFDTVNVEFNLRPWIRNLAKYGDFFLYNEVAPEIGVVNVSPIPVNEISREENFDQNDPHAIRFRMIARGNKILEAWQITHFRIQGNDLFLPYGTSVLESARRIWRQLIMIEDAMLVYRVVRSPERRVFYIDVGNTAPNDIPAFMEAAKATLRSNTLTDKSSGHQDQRYNPVAVDEDYIIPVRGTESGTRIETLAGGQHVSATEDVEYIQKKLFSALGIPRAYLGYDESLSSKATLAQEDVRFSRTITIIQKIIIAELNKLAMLHLYAKGFDGEDLINFELFLSNPSSVALQQKLALWNDRIDIASKFKESVMVGQDWIQEEILGFTPEERQKQKADIKQDVLFQKELESIAVSAENQERQATMDPFDQSNYSVPGAAVPKNPGQNGQPPQGGRVSDQELISGISSFDSEGKVIHSDTPPGQGPIAATPLATHRRRNDKRRVGMGGDFNLQTPDFKRMLDMGGSNVYNTDITDNEYLNKRGRNESFDMAKTLRRAPELSGTMKRLFKEFDKKHNIKKNVMIMEDLEDRLSEALDKNVLEEGSSSTPEAREFDELAEVLLGDKSDSEDKDQIDFQLIEDTKH